ncbi:hypothetical protein CB0940_12204 [Cercospora beticola]|uniref:CCHC-type domain-containing protein n=1 Tax=Cercospora beticola TaxID=122368 RepID=A0A2G5GRT2_CERBT|nr:hypothetical protein CB0940_12204 [Cercospora beticola]PIA82984.1 hypothetical protein CB0940_12204 [Cercospora beticola]
MLCQRLRGHEKQRKDRAVPDGHSCRDFCVESSQEGTHHKARAETDLRHIADLSNSREAAMVAGADDATLPPDIASTETAARKRTIRATRTEINYQRLHRGLSIDSSPGKTTKSAKTTKTVAGVSDERQEATIDRLYSLILEMKEESQKERAEHQKERAELQAEIRLLREQQKEWEDRQKTWEEQQTTWQQQVTQALSGSQSPRTSYADIARTPPSSRPSNIQSLSTNTTASARSDTLYCTIDTSRVEEEEKRAADPAVFRKAIENEMRRADGQEGWRCVAVTKDPRNTARIRVICRNEPELARVKEAAQKATTPGVRVLQDQLYPIKVDNANRTAILNDTGDLRADAVERLERENEVTIAKIVWLSRKNSGKAYGSMAVYLSKGSDAVRLLQEQYFHVAGESAYTRVYERRQGPVQCYKCQEIGHKTYSCENLQRCARCTQTGHRHSECNAEIPKCVLCSGPHESYSKNCRTLYPTLPTNPN